MHDFKRIALLLLTLIIGLLLGCQESTPAFRLLPAEQSGITFANTISISDSFNILENEFVYNGGGVAVGDLNGDGLQDVFFTGNQVDNRLYLNQGQLQFEDVTKSAGLQKTNSQQWSSGVNILDINLDGKADVYVCNTLQADSSLRRNLLYINQGNTSEGIPTFKEMGAAYGVDDPSHSSHAQFFDYDRDGDLDLFVGVNLIEERYPNQFIDLSQDGTAANRDNLFENQWNDSLEHPVFTDVSIQAGILQDGYSHSTLIHDFNEDGWPDIYVANDYQSNDLIFINNKDKTFTNQAGKIFKHFSLSAMGSDVGDINNDGAADFFVSEMQPYYNKRKKLFQGGSSYQNQQLTEKYGYQYQYTRNTLQLHTGINPETELPLFSEIGMYARVQETDWSWATLFADFDNDGWQDLYIANGFPKDVTDRDFSDFRAYASNLVSTEKLYAAIPEVKSPNFLFRNTGSLGFENKAKDWGLALPSFSNGAAYADLDNDGDLDLVVNNIDDPAFVFENALSGNALRIRLKGAPKNPDAFGASVELRQGKSRQKAYLISGRGYLSQSENVFHFGLGQSQKVDSLIVHWPDGRRTIRTQVAAQQLVELSYEPDASEAEILTSPPTAYFNKTATDRGLLYNNQEYDFIDFNFQRTLPHKFSQYGPSISVGDINGDKRDDLFLAGSRGHGQHWFLQQADGNFVLDSVNYKSDPGQREEDVGSLLFDAEGDGDLDLYIVRGGGQVKANDLLYQDVLYLNDGNGQLQLASDALPRMLANGSCVKAADFDRDGDLDLFVGSRVKPASYPLPDRSYVLRNDSKATQVRFTDVTAEVCPALLTPGLVSDALWTDYDGDDWPDLLLAAEWMPIKVFHNQQGTFQERTAESGLADYPGWWNSLAAADLDQDGDVDYIAGNFGENIYYRCNAQEPIRIYGKDLDSNGSIDPLISCYWPDSLGKKQEYLYHPREDLIKQFVGIRKKFNTYAAYGEASVGDMFSEEEMKDALVLEAKWMKSSVLENKGDGRFVVHALPAEAQLAPIYGILPYDVDADGRKDLLLVGNDYGMEMQQGRADALSGLVLLGGDNFQFDPLRLEDSHFAVLGAGIGIVSMLAGEQEELVLSTQNRDSLEVFELAKPSRAVYHRLEATEVKARHHFSDGRIQLEELYPGSGFLSQKGHYLRQLPEVDRIELFDQKGQLTRELGKSLQ